ncbi:MAG TPA: hypothetical protein VLS25_11600, partial [Dehalococcoidia bacterium]|nr:hypothetical protein [Dehalococcoidia bacterium]
MRALSVPKASILAGFLPILIYLMFLGSGSAASAGTFTASTNVTLSSNATNASADSNVLFSIPSPDYNFYTVVNGSPAASFLAPGPGNPGFASGTHPALGDVVGNLSSSTFLGLTNNPCANNLTVTFTFLNATVDITHTIDPVPQAATNSGDGGTLTNQWTDDGSSAGADAPWNAAWPGLSAAERANGLPAQVDAYPSYLNTIFTPDGGSPVQPLARYAGATNVASTIVTLNIVVFAPDALANAFPAPHPFNDLKDIGYTAIAV